jgi:tetratricopeptide (TPR) repeat protein
MVLASLAALEAHGGVGAATSMQGAPQPGSSPLSPIHVDGMVERNDYVTQEVCRGVPPKSLEQDFKTQGDVTRVRVQVQCPGGDRQTLFFEEPTVKEADGAPYAPLAPAVDGLIRLLGEKWGVSTKEDVKEAVLAAHSRAVRNDGWFLDYLGDFLGTERIWQDLLKADPQDLEAAVQLFTTRERLQNPKGALAALDQASTDAKVYDTRGMVMLKPSALFSNRCAVEWRLGHPDAAMAACQKALSLGSKGGANLGLAKIYYSRGDNEHASAVAQIAASTPVGARALFYQGLILLEKGESERAKQYLLTSIRAEKTFGPAIQALLGQKRTHQEWQAAEVAEDREWPSLRLASCGHYYLELDMPQRSEKCFAEADRLVKGPALAERLLHRAESDAKGALAAAKAAAKSNPHPALLGAVAVMLFATGQQSESMRWADYAFEADPGDARTNELLGAMCGKTAPWDCIEHYRSTLGQRTKPWVQ